MANSNEVMAFGYSAYPLANGRFCLTSELDEKIHILSREEFEVLRLCSMPRSVVDHAFFVDLGMENANFIHKIRKRLLSSTWSKLPIEIKRKVILPNVMDILNRLSESSLLVPLNDIKELLSNRVNYESCNSGTDNEIEYLCVPTCNRPSNLERSMNSFIENTSAYGRTHKWVVIDDSRNSKDTEENKAALQTLKKRYRQTILYSNRKDRLEFCEQLAGYTGENREDIIFALLGRDKLLPSIGAARNSILALTYGALTIQFDDDTMCQASRPPEYQSNVKLHSNNNLSDFWFFSNHNSMMESLEFISCDIVGMHKEVLGKSFADYYRSLHNIDLDVCDIGNDFIRSISSGIANIGLSFLGAAGDPGSNVTIHRLFSSGATLNRLVSNQNDYRMAKSTYHVLRCARQITLTTMPFCIPMNMGLDNRSYVPPFMPVLRTEDGVFMQAHKKIYSNSLTALLPLAVLHLPPAPRSEDVRSSTIQRYNTNLFLAQIISEIEGISGNTPRDRIRSLGQELISIASYSHNDFAFFVRKTWMKFTISLIQLAQMKLSSDNEMPEYLKEDLEKLSSDAEKHLLESDYFLPYDLENPTEKPYSNFQNLILQYGRVVKIWPDIIDASRELHKRGCTMADEI